MTVKTKFSHQQVYRRYFFVLKLSKSVPMLDDCRYYLTSSRTRARLQNRDYRQPNHQPSCCGTESAFLRRPRPSEKSLLQSHQHRLFLFTFYTRTNIACRDLRTTPANESKQFRDPNSISFYLNAPGIRSALLCALLEFCTCA